MKSVGSLILISMISLVAFAESADRGLLPELKLQQDEDLNQKKAVQSEIMIAKTETNAINALKKIIEKKKGTSQEPDLWFRLAELYMRRAKSGRFFDMTRGQENSPVRFAPPEIKEQSALGHLKQAVSIFNRIEKDFPRFEDMDSVLFNNAFANQQMNQKKFAQMLYERMVQKFSNSPLLPDAHLALGEMNYDAGTFSKALEHFQAVGRFPQSRVYSYGLYKEAWTRYNLHQSEEAIQKLLDVVKFFDPKDTSHARVSHNLRSEALRDLALFFEESHTPDGAYRFFAGICQPEELNEAMLVLGKIYDSHGRQKDMNVFLPEFIKKTPESAVLVKAEQLLIQGNETLRSRQDVIRHLEAAADLCKPDSPWRKAHAANAASDCDFDLAHATTDLAKKWWELWLKNKTNKEMAELTEKAFKIRLDQEDPAKPDVKSHYAYAELLFQREKFREASAQYEFVAVKSVDTQMAFDSAYSAVVALEKASEKQVQADDAKHLLTLCDTYLAQYPKSPLASQIRFKAGFIQYESKHDVEAEKWLKPLALDRQQEISLRIRSEDLVLDIYNSRHDLNALRDFARTLMNQTEKVDRKKSMQKIMQEADYNSIQQDLKKNEATVSIQNLVTFAHENKESSPLSKDSLWQAIGLAFSSGHTSQGAALALEYAKLYPQDSQSTEALRKAAHQYSDQGFLLKAAAAFELLAPRLKGEDQAKVVEAISEIYTMENKKTLARQFLHKLLEQSDKKDQGKIYTKLFRTYKGEESTPEYVKLENKVLSMGLEPLTSEIQLKKIEALFAQKKYSEVFQLTKSIVGGAAPNALRARARLLQAKILEQELVAQSTKTSLDHLSLVLSMKTEKLDKVQTAYLSASQLCTDAQIQLEALEGLDRSYRDYVYSVENPMIKASMTNDEKAALQGELAKLVKPIHEKQVEIEKKLQTIVKSEKALIKNQIDFAAYPLTESVKPGNPEIPYGQFAPYLPQMIREESLLVRRDQPSGSCLTEVGEKKRSLSNLVDLTNRCLVQKKTAMAEVWIEQIAETAPQTGLAPYYLSLLAQQNGQKDKAIYLADLALKKNNDPAFFHYQKAILNDSTEGAALVNQEMIKAYDGKLDAWETKVTHGIIAFSQGDCLSAAEDLRDLSDEMTTRFKLAPATSECLAQKGEVFRGLKLTQQALAKQKSVELALHYAHLEEAYQLDSRATEEAYRQALPLARDPVVKDWIQRKLNWLKNPTQMTQGNGSISKSVAQEMSSGEEK